MITKSMEIRIPTGLDPSTIALFIQTASQYDSKVYVQSENKKVNAKSLMGMMTLGLPKGANLTVVADGSDEAKAIEDIEKYLSNDKQDIADAGPVKTGDRKDRTCEGCLSAALLVPVFFYEMIIDDNGNRIAMIQQTCMAAVLYLFIIPHRMPRAADRNLQKTQIVSDC